MVPRNITIIGEGSAKCRTTCALGAPGIPWSALRMVRREFADDSLGLGLALLEKTTHDDLPERLPLLLARGRKED